MSPPDCTAPLVAFEGALVAFEGALVAFEGALVTFEGAALVAFEGALVAFGGAAAKFAVERAADRHEPPHPAKLAGLRAADEREPLHQHGASVENKATVLRATSRAAATARSMVWPLLLWLCRAMVVLFGFWRLGTCLARRSRERHRRMEEAVTSVRRARDTARRQAWTSRERARCSVAAAEASAAHVSAELEAAQAELRQVRGECARADEGAARARAQADECTARASFLMENLPLQHVDPWLEDARAEPRAMLAMTRATKLPSRRRRGQRGGRRGHGRPRARDHQGRFVRLPPGWKPEWLHSPPRWVRDCGITTDPSALGYSVYTDPFTPFFEVQILEPVGYNTLYETPRRLVQLPELIAAHDDAIRGRLADDDADDDLLLAGPPHPWPEADDGHLAGSPGIGHRVRARHEQARGGGGGGDGSGGHIVEPDAPADLIADSPGIGHRVRARHEQARDGDGGELDGGTEPEHALHDGGVQLDGPAADTDTGGFERAGDDPDSIGARVHARHADGVDALAVCASPCQRGRRDLERCNGLGLAQPPASRAKHMLVQSRARWIQLGGEDFKPTSTRPADPFGENVWLSEVARQSFARHRLPPPLRAELARLAKSSATRGRLADIFDAPVWRRVGPMAWATGSVLRGARGAGERAVRAVTHISR